MDNKMEPSPNLTAAQAVFSTYELIQLIQLIILALPAEDITLPTRVNLACHAVATTSTTINEKLREAAIEHHLELNAYPFSANDRNCFAAVFTKYGRVVIRRVGDTELVARLPASCNRAFPMPPVIVDDMRRKVQFTRVTSSDEYDDWLVVFEDKEFDEKWCARVWILVEDEREYLKKYHSLQAGERGV